MEGDKIPLLIADDHKLFAHSFAEFINNHTACQVVGIVHDGKELLHKLNSLRVDIVLLDINMPLMNGIEAAVKIKERFPQLKIIAVSQYTERQILEAATKAGVDGYFVKNGDPETFIDILQAVLSGKLMLDCPPIESPNRNSHDYPLDTFSARFGLTKRELEIVQLIRENRSNKEIAERLFISQYTVETHTKSICRKLHTSERNEVIRFANAYL